jgi:hypothetical protein
MTQRHLGIREYWAANILHAPLEQGPYHGVEEDTWAFGRWGTGVRAKKMSAESCRQELESWQVGRFECFDAHGGGFAPHLIDLAIWAESVVVLDLHREW